MEFTFFFYVEKSYQRNLYVTNPTLKSTTCKTVMFTITSVFNNNEHTCTCIIKRIYTHIKLVIIVVFSAGGQRYDAQTRHVSRA